MTGRAGPRVLVSAGETSGDGLAAPVIAHLVALGCDVIGVGGPRMVAAGLKPVAPFEGLAAHGLLEAARSVPAAHRALQSLVAALPQADVVLAVDFPEVNRRLLARAASHQLRSWLAPPQAWAWRAWRATALQPLDWVGCVLPFAADWYRARGVAAHFVGHPLASLPALPPAGGRGIALLPGSRPTTARRLLRIQLEAARAVRARDADVTFHLGLAPGLSAAALGEVPRWVEVHAGARAALACAQTAWVGAGTATLDAVLAGRPPLIMARLRPGTERVARRVVSVRAVGLPNLVLGDSVFPELVFEACTPAAVAAHGGQLRSTPGAWVDPIARVRAALWRPAWGASIAQALVAQVEARRRHR